MLNFGSLVEFLLDAFWRLLLFAAEFAGLGSLVNGADVVVLIGDERQLPPPTALPASSSSRSFFSALKGQ